MSQPTPTDVHVDAILTNMSVAYIQNAANFVAGRVFPSVPVRKQSDKYFTYPKNIWFLDAATQRAPGTETTGGGFPVSTDSYFADVFGTHVDVDGQTLANADSPLEPFTDATELVTQRMMLRRERQFMTDFFVTGVWANEVAGGTGFTKWDDAVSNPERDIAAAKATILKSTGFLPNVLLVSYEVHQRLKEHPLIKDRFKYVSSESITASMIASFLEIEDYVVSMAIYATNTEGGTAAYDFTAGKNALLCYRNPAPALRKPSAGYIMDWTGLIGSSAGTRIKRFYIDALDSTRIEGETAFDCKKVADDLGYFFLNAVS